MVPEIENEAVKKISERCQRRAESREPFAQDPSAIDGSYPVIDLFTEPSEKLGVSQAIKNIGFLALKSPDEPTTSQYPSFSVYRRSFLRTSLLRRKNVRNYSREQRVGKEEVREVGAFFFVILSDFQMCHMQFGPFQLPSWR